MALQDKSNTPTLSMLQHLEGIALFDESNLDSFENLLRYTAECLEADDISLSLWTDETCQELSVVFSNDTANMTTGTLIKPGEGLHGWVTQQGIPIRINQGAASDPALEHHGVATDLSAMCWPLKNNKQIIGALYVCRHKESPAFSDDDLQNGLIYTSVLASRIQNARVMAKQKHQIHMMELMNKRYLENNRKLAATDKRLLSILASLDDVVWSTLPESNQVIYLSPAAEKVYGRPVQAFYDDHSLWVKILHEEDRQRVLNKIDSNLYQKGVLDLDYRIMHPDGSFRWLHDHIRVIYGDNGKPIRHDGIAVDITKYMEAQEQIHKNHEELKSAYDKLQETQNQLLQSEKMASIGQLAAGVAHEINNPIGFVYSNIGTLEKYIQDLFELIAVYESAESSLMQTPEVLTHIQSTKQAVDLEFLKGDITDLMRESKDGISRVKKIVQDLKDFSHVGAEDEWQFCDLLKGLDSTLNIVNNEIKYKAEVIKQYQTLPEVECLPSQLNQVLMNLLVNASHAIEERGTITLKSGVDGDHVWLEVIDSGKGISPENMTKIFNPFFTTKPVGKGTGLGLSVSYSIIEKHHGEIKVTSEVGKGHNFPYQLTH